MMRSCAQTAVIVVALLTLSACAIESPESAVPVEYDFGPLPSYARGENAIPAIVMIASVRAPGWIDSDGIVYRLLYEGAARPQSYAMSRWAAEPPLLLGDRLRSRLAAVSRGVVSSAFGARSDYTLRVELEDFSQQFEAPGQSRALLRARVTLLGSAPRILLAQRVFEVQQPAEPHAQGAVKALTVATDRFLDELLPWVAAIVARSPVAGDLSTSGAIKE